MDFYIMSRDTAVAEWKNNNFTVFNKKLLPMYLARTGNVEHWLEIRAIDFHRANSRLLKKALRIIEKDDISTVIGVNAVTITDSYWVKTPDSSLTYDNVRFDNDYFSNLALRGTYDSFNRAMNSKSNKTPELTNTGSFEKCWKLHNGEWWMYKKANHNEQFSEIFIYEFGKALGMNMAVYVRGDRCVKTKDFTGNAAVNFEPAFNFMDDNENYVDVVGKLREIAPELIRDYVKMIFLDTIVANPDRHTFNFGILRDVETGKIIGFAPNFDNNMALIARGYPNNIKRKNDVLVKLFHELTDYDQSFREMLPEVSENIIISILNKINMKVKSKIIIDFILNAYRQI